MTTDSKSYPTFNRNTTAGLLGENVRQALKQPLVFIGMMGAGKTSIGRLCSYKLGVPFVDADHEIVASAGCEISEIFARFGEQAFRDGEKKVIARLLSDDTLKVLSVGGGAFTNEQTRTLLLEQGIVIWLRASLATLVQRTSLSFKTRPLLQSGSPEETLKKLLESREHLYNMAHIVIDTDGLSHEETVEKTLVALSEWLEAKDL